MLIKLLKLFLMTSAAIPRLKYQAEKRQTRYTYTDGPMIYLGQQIVKKMQDAGYPSKIFYGYRSAELQLALYNKRPKVTNARPYESPHQYYEAVDIVHETLFWNAPPEYWETLSAVVQVVSKEFGVGLTHGHNWQMVDSAHIELSDWRFQKAKVGLQCPTQKQLADRFAEVLPRQWVAYSRRTAGLC